MARRLVYRWDLDKTYLRTEFDTLRDLLRTAFEPASQKRTVPGAAALLRELRRTEPLGIFIVSGSPEHMRRVLEAKLRLDGVRWDGFVLKPQLRHLLRGRFRLLRDQVGYKLGALLASRASLPAETDEFMFGDDAEADAFIYSMYADLCAGEVGTDTLMTVLRLAGVYEDGLPRLVRLASRIPRHAGARRIFIHLDRVSSPHSFVEYGRRVCPFYNYFQPALVLLEEGTIEASAALRVAAELVQHQAFSADALVASYADLFRRGQIGRGAAEALLRELGGGHHPSGARTGRTLRALGGELEPLLAKLEPPPSHEPRNQPIDYVRLFGRDRDRAMRAKRHGRI